MILPISSLSRRLLLSRTSIRRHLKTDKAKTKEKPPNQNHGFTKPQPLPVEVGSITNTRRLRTSWPRKFRLKEVSNIVFAVPHVATHSKPFLLFVPIQYAGQPAFLATAPISSFYPASWAAGKYATLAAMWAGRFTLDVSKSRILFPCLLTSSRVQSADAESNTRHGLACTGL